MGNSLLILLAQRLPAFIRRSLDPLRPRTNHGQVSEPARLEGIDHSIPAGVARKRALATFRPDIWLAAVAQHPNISLYNHYGFVYSLVKALNEAGFVVDLVDPYSTDPITGNYDIFVGHGGNCRHLLEQLPPDIPVYQYISGLYWRAFDRESSERYERFYNKAGIPVPSNHRRDIKPLSAGLEYLNARANTLFSIHCPRMIAGYGPYASKFFFTGLGAYIDPLFVSTGRDFDAGRRNFIYVGGTGGNLQKGLDLLIEAFQQTPGLHLYIYCKVEEEIYQHCRRELCASNIHYIYHWRYRPFHRRLRALLNRTNFSVHAPINIGMGTAFMGTMGAGMIPVGYVDLHEPGESAVLTDSWQVDALAQCIRRASEQSPAWCRNASAAIVAKYQELCEPDQVERNFKAMFSRDS